MNLVYLYLLKRAPEKAILQLKEVLALEPENAEATEKLAELLFRKAVLTSASASSRSKRAARSVPASLLVILGDAYLAKNDLSKAEEYFLVALEGRLDNAGALFGLAQLSRMKGELKEASIYLNRVAMHR